MKSYILAGTLIDGRSDEAVRGGAVLVEDGKVVAAGPRQQVPQPSDATVIDLSEMTVLPGLMDLHAHFARTGTEDAFSRSLEPMERQLIRSVVDVERLLKAGFTTVRCPGGMNAIYLRDAIQAKEILGPRIIPCGKLISMTGGHGDKHFMRLEWARLDEGHRLADGVSDCRLAAREQLRAGAEFIKICTTGGVASMRDFPWSVQFSDEEVRAFVQEAEDAGTYVAAHAQGAKGIMRAITNGVRTIEHGSLVDEPTATEMLKRKNYLIPTLVRMWKGLHEGKRVGTDPWQIAKLEKMVDVAFANINMAYQMGVPIAVGTDYGGRPFTRHGDNALELQLLVEKVGMKPMDVIQSATRISAEAACIDKEVGTLESRLSADLIAVNGDPLTDISVLQKVSFVMRSGNIIVQ